ncbi:hypothetical protein CFP56_041070 [Quercus suber]|uniref:Uncharacterized protein n=1 Tax=Quercus suber TaxID=58331 RepID=A0AAW0LLF1_QUESU|nr:hypothetical protein CFP56_46304 [Quercus suber]
MNLVMAHALFPLAVGTVILFFPFKAIDAANLFLCVIMLFSITTLVAIGLSVARKDLLGSITALFLSVNLSALPAVQGFAFTALATSLIGYAVSFPKQLIDTLQLIFGKVNSGKLISFNSQKVLMQMELGELVLLFIQEGLTLEM